MTDFDNKRWYDQDATVSLAVSILRNANYENQLIIANFLIEKGKDHNLPTEKIREEKNDSFFRRWYDFDETLYCALECLRLLESEVRSKLAIDIINYLYNLDKVVENNEEL